MTRQKHVLAFALALAVLVATVASSASARTDRAGGSKAATITIWDFFVNSPKERAALMRVADAWAKKTGNKVVNPGDVADSLTKYPLAARGGRGPDVIQFPHDNLGRFAAAGVIGSSPSGFAVDTSLYAPVATQAITYKGKIWGLPIARESTFLFYNKALIATPPKTWGRADRRGNEAHLGRSVRLPLGAGRLLLRLRLHRRLRRVRLPVDQGGLQRAPARPRHARCDRGLPADPGSRGEAQAGSGDDDLRHHGREVRKRPGGDDHQRPMGRSELRLEEDQLRGRPTADAPERQGVRHRSWACRCSE